MADFSLCMGMATPSPGNYLQQQPNRLLAAALDPFNFQRSTQSGLASQYSPYAFPNSAPLNPLVPGLIPGQGFNGPGGLLAPLFGALAYLEALLSGQNRPNFSPPVLQLPQWLPPQQTLRPNVQRFLEGKVSRDIPPFPAETIEKLNPSQEPNLKKALAAINQDAQGRLLLEQMIKNGYTIRRDVIKEQGVAGYTDPDKHEIVINAKLRTAEAFLSTIGHEMFHVIPDIAGDRKDSQREEAFAEAGGDALAARILRQNPLIAVSIERLEEIQQMTEANYKDLPIDSRIEESIRAIGIAV